MLPKLEQAPALPGVEAIRAHMLTALSRYWPNCTEPVAALPIVQLTLTEPITGTLRLIEVKLGVGSRLRH